MIDSQPEGRQVWGTFLRAKGLELKRSSSRASVATFGRLGVRPAGLGDAEHAEPVATEIRKLSVGIQRRTVARQFGSGSVVRGSRARGARVSRSVSRGTRPSH